MKRFLPFVTKKCWKPLKRSWELAVSIDLEKIRILSLIGK
ncbi:hypothetical protein D932_02582 [Enterococcus casseliflavus 14-MB-W-14]|nr:hypothetical protein D932_02582 [Enterococcus casseliflavus 14-MB-W-14]